MKTIPIQRLKLIKYFSSFSNIPKTTIIDNGAKFIMLANYKCKD
jgi:hypothetical protein